MSYCETCGSEVRENARFCATCGAVQEAFRTKESYRPIEHFENVSVTQPSSALFHAWLIVSGIAYGIGFILFIFFIIITTGPYGHNDVEIFLGLACLSLILLDIPAIILYSIWFFRTWKAVPSEFRGCSPGRAVGLLFVPIFNFYWIFRAIPGLSRSIDRALTAIDKREHGSIGFGVGVAACVISLIPYVNILAWPLLAFWAWIVNTKKNILLTKNAVP